MDSGTGTGTCTGTTMDEAFFFFHPLIKPDLMISCCFMNKEATGMRCWQKKKKKEYCGLVGRSVGFWSVGQYHSLCLVCLCVFVCARRERKRVWDGSHKYFWVFTFSSFSLVASSYMFRASWIYRRDTIHGSGAGYFSVCLFLPFSFACIW
ncbi:hypothetical protein VTK26DRAFT_1052 [Humicola hyalothermophila]